MVERHQYSTTVNPSDWTTLYDAFGASHGAIEVNGQQQSNQLNIESVGFGGQWGYYTDNELDQVTGVVPQGRLTWTLNGLRYYDPSVGRFLTRDPVGYEGGINLYTFCGNNPVNYADPSGLDPKDDMNWLSISRNFLKGEVRAANPINWAKGLYKSVEYVTDSFMENGASTQPFKDLGSSFINNLDFWNKTDPTQAGESFMTDLLIAAPLIKRIPNPTPLGLNGLFGSSMDSFTLLAFDWKGANQFRIDIGKLPIKGTYISPNLAGKTIPHYHLRKVNLKTGETYEGQGIGRHRPYQISPKDKSFRDRF